jgi:hypothetical protein
MSLLLLTVVSHSRRHPRSPPLRQRGSLYRQRWAPAMMRWISGFFLVAFHRWMGQAGGDELDCWVFAGVQAGVPPVVLRRSLYVIYSTCLPPYNVVRPGASSHCERRPCHLRLCVCRPCCACVLPAFPSCVRGLRDFQGGLLGVRGALSQALHAACDAHLLPTLRALHYRVAYAFVSANVPRLVVRVCCVVLRGTHHTLPMRGYFFTDVTPFLSLPSFSSINQINTQRAFCEYSSSSCLSSRLPNILTDLCLLRSARKPTLFNKLDRGLKTSPWPQNLTAASKPHRGLKT